MIGIGRDEVVAGVSGVGLARVHAFDQQMGEHQELGPLGLETAVQALRFGHSSQYSASGKPEVRKTHARRKLSPHVGAAFPRNTVLLESAMTTPPSPPPNPDRLPKKKQKRKRSIGLRIKSTGILRSTLVVLAIVFVAAPE